MGNVQSYVVPALAVGSLYLVYSHIYCSYTLLKTNVLNNDRLPSSVYLYIKQLIRALTRRTGCLYTATTNKCDVVYTVFNCRLRTAGLRRFCSAAGYGWDYPDTEYRDIPLCFPESLCHRLLLMVLTDDGFMLSPAGLVRVRQSLKTLEPVDELKKGPFMLQVRVLEYQQVEAGVEVSICLSATSRTGSQVWQSILTLLSKNKLHHPSRCVQRHETESPPGEPVPDTVKQVELRVPRTADLGSVWCSSDFPPSRLLSSATRLFGYRTQASPSLWMLSVCLAEIEKHRGVEVITAPVSITAHFKEPLSVPGRVTIKFWETSRNEGQCPAKVLSFHMQQHGSNVSHLMGFISKS